MTERLDEIRARLEAATPGPWDVSTVGENPANFVRYPNGMAFCQIGNLMDAEFIAASPEDIAYLLKEVERLQQQVIDRDKAAKRVIQEPRPPLRQRQKAQSERFRVKQP